MRQEESKRASSSQRLDTRMDTERLPAAVAPVASSLAGSSGILAAMGSHRTQRRATFTGKKAQGLDLALSGLSRSDMSRVLGVNRARGRAVSPGLADLRIHDLRHTFCSRLAENGESLRITQRLAGHKSYATNERYAHLQEDALRRAVERLCPVPSPADTNPGE